MTVEANGSGAFLTSAIESLRAQLAAVPAANVSLVVPTRIRLADHLAEGGDWQGAAAELGEARRASLASDVEARVKLAATSLAARHPAAGRNEFLRACGYPPTTLRDRRATRETRAPRFPTPPSRVDASRWPIPATPRSSPPAATPSHIGVGPAFEAAMAALTEGKPIRARRLGEESSRLAPPNDVAHQRNLEALVAALAGAGAERDSLLLSRAMAESDGVPTASTKLSTGRSLQALVDRARNAGALDLAKAWTTDFRGSTSRTSIVSRGEADVLSLSPLRQAERAIWGITQAVPSSGAVASDVAEAAAPIISESQFVLGQPSGASPAVLATALARFGDMPVPTATLLKAGWQAEPDPRRRARLAERWLTTSLAQGESFEALSGDVDQVIDDLPGPESVPLRRIRAERLRLSGKPDMLVSALGEDAEHFDGPESLRMRIARADLWDQLGEPARALELRLRVLIDAPAEPAALGAARRRLQSEGRLVESLDLAAAAVIHVPPGERLALLRDIASLAATIPGEQDRAAVAGLEILKVDFTDTAAREEVDRLLSQPGEEARLGEFLAWVCARDDRPEARATSLWRLAEFRRSVQGDLTGALSLYRQIAELPGFDALRDAAFADDDWKRRDDALALHTARVVVAPSPSAKAAAWVDRAAALLDADKIDAADRDLGRAMDLGEVGARSLDQLERLYRKRSDYRGFRQRLQARLASAKGSVAAWLWYGLGRANDGLQEPEMALTCYTKAVEFDDRLRPALQALRERALKRGDALEGGRLLEKEVELAEADAAASLDERIALRVEWASLMQQRLGQNARALEAFEVVLAKRSVEPRALEGLFEAAVAVGRWERAAQALETMLGAQVGVKDAAERYYRVARVAETAGDVDRALTLYSRSYARMTSYRPTLERLSEICFERQQWDNAWKATEHLIDRHGADLDADARAELALRAGLADLHVAQRFVAAQRVSAMLKDAVPGAGLREVSDSWASMRLEPRLLVGIEHERRGRILSRLGQVLSLTEANPRHTARQRAREVLAALAVVDRRWADALAMLDAFGSDATLGARRQAEFLVAAGDILFAQGDLPGATRSFRRAAEFDARNPSLRRASVVGLLSADATNPDGVHSRS